MISVPEEIDLTDFTFIIPAVAVGNIGQLCADLLITTLNMQRIEGGIWNERFIPLVGQDPYNLESTAICNALDLYVSLEKKLLVLQTRSLHVSPLKRFCEEIAELMEKRKIGKIVILSSSYRHESNPELVSYMKYIASPDILETNQEFFVKLNWKEHCATPLGAMPTERISGGGFANLLTDILLNKNLPFIVLFQHYFEGDNVKDSFEFTQQINSWLNLLTSNKNGGPCIKCPPSWNHFFGNSPPEGIF